MMNYAHLLLLAFSLLIGVVIPLLLLAFVLEATLPSLMGLSQNIKQNLICSDLLLLFMLLQTPRSHLTPCGGA